MNDHLKCMWRYYLALILIVALLCLPINWIYKTADAHLGKGIALITLTISVMSTLLTAVGGAMYTHRIYCDLRKRVKTLEFPVENGRVQTPVVLRVLKMDIPPPAPLSPNPVAIKVIDDELYPELLSLPRKRRGKQSRFPEDKIWKAVLKWERRDTFFEHRNLEDFLEDEFGIGGDGILLMAPSTFYDWRRYVLQEIQDHHHHPPCSGSKQQNQLTSSEPNSPKTFS